MYKKLLIFSLISLIVLMSLFLTSCSAIKAFGNKNIDETVYYGTAEADKVDISAEVAGRIKTINVQEGQKVSAGSLIAVLDTPENVIKAQQSELSVKSAENELAKLNEGSRAEEIKAQAALAKQAEAVVKQTENALNQADENQIAAQTTYDYKKKIFDDTEALYNSDSASKQDLDNAKYALDVAQSALANTQYAKETAKHQVESAEAQLTAAQEKLDLLRHGVTEKTKTSAQFGIEQAEKGYSLSKLLLDKGNIVALSEGVVESVNYSIGEYVTPGSAVITVINPNDMWVKIFIPEKNLPLVKLNQEVTIKSDFLKDQIIKGKITYIATEAEFTPMNIVTKKDRMKLVYAVKVKVLDHLDTVKPGMLLDIDLD